MKNRKNYKSLHILRIAGIYDDLSDNLSSNLINRLNILLQNKSGTPLNISFQGKQKRNFCSVTFLAKAIEYLFSGSSKTEPQIIFNVADIKSYAIKEICNEYIKRGCQKSSIFLMIMRQKTFIT